MWYKNESVAHSALCKYNESIGKSVENRDIPALHISKVKTKDHFRIYFQCQIHGSELYDLFSKLNFYPITNVTISCY